MPITSAKQGKAVRVTDNPLYVAWIEEYSKKEFLTAGCFTACEDMQKGFAELFIVRGSIHLSNGCFNSWDFEIEGLEPGISHFWLETEEGDIVDPSAFQFLDPKGCYRAQKIVKYYPFDESKAEQLPTGKCPNCGDYCYNGDDFCTEVCGTSYHAYIMSECRR